MVGSSYRENGEREKEERDIESYRDGEREKEMDIESYRDGEREKEEKRAIRRKADIVYKTAT